MTKFAGLLIFVGILCACWIMFYIALYPLVMNGIVSSPIESILVVIPLGVPLGRLLGVPLLISMEMMNNET